MIALTWKIDIAVVVIASTSALLCIKADLKVRNDIETRADETIDSLERATRVLWYCVITDITVVV